MNPISPERPVSFLKINNAARHKIRVAAAALSCVAVFW
jgi:hypothetical protein